MKRVMCWALLWKGVLCVSFRPVMRVLRVLVGLWVECPRVVRVVHF